MYPHSLKRNLIYQGMYQFIILFIPLIINPYLTRTLGGEALGIYSFTNSIAYYFIMFGTLGIARYGQRIISTNRNDFEKLRTTFWSLFFTHLISSILSVIAFLVFILFFAQNDKKIYLIQSLYVISALFDITWLFYGLEDFKNVIVRNFIIKILELILIIVFVKKRTDLWKYTLIMTSSILTGQVILWPQAIKKLPYKHFTMQDAIPHIKPLLTLWISVIASALYTVFDKTLIGLFINKETVAYYEYADKIVRVPISLLATIGTVTYPRMCNIVSKNNQKEQSNIFTISIFMTAILGCGAFSIISCIGKSFVEWYYGEAFAPSAGILIYLSPIIIFISLGDIIRTQILIPRNMDKKFVFAVCMNAIVNLTASISLIPVIGVYGAVAGTLIAELCGLILNIIFSIQYFDIATFLKNTIPSILIGTMAIIIFKISNKCFISNDIYLGVFSQFFFIFILYSVFTGIYILARSNVKRFIKGARTNA